MTILPKKKPSQEKRGSDTVESTSHHGGHPHSSGHHAHTSNVEPNRGGARPKTRNSPPRWVALSSLEERLTPHESIAGFDGSERRETAHNSHGGSKRARHRSSPHRHERSKRPVPRKHHRDLPSGSGLQLERCERVPIPEAVEIDFNSGDEYDDVDHTSNEEVEEREALFEKMLKESKGFLIKQMEPDGACLFRAVADQVYGDQEWHSEVRRHCMDYMMKNCDYFSQYVTEDFATYIRRKRMDNCHGNHVEMQAISELYNRNIEVYLYSTEPINTFHTINKTDNFPIRLSYHRSIHYNSVIDPSRASVGVGLGMPSFYPGLADKRLMRDALLSSENSEIEKAMLEDKLRATDWEATNEALEEQVAQDSYIQWLKENELRSRKKSRPAIAASSSTPAENSPGRGDRAGASSAPPCSSVSHRGQHSPRQRSGTSKSAQNSPDRPETMRKAHHSPRGTDGAGSSSRFESGVQKEHVSPRPQETTSKEAETRKTPSPPAGPSGLTNPFMINQSASFMQNFPPAEFGLSAWETEEAILATVLAQSQQEYLDILRRPSQTEDDDEDSS